MKIQSFIKISSFFFILSIFLSTQVHCRTRSHIPVSKEVSWSEIFAQAKGKVVQVFASGNAFDWSQPFKQGDLARTCGTGFIATEQGDIYTNFHVIEDMDIFTIQHPDTGKERFELDFFGASEQYDWAHLRLKPSELKRLQGMLAGGKLKYFELANSDGLPQGHEVMVIGYPLGVEDIKHSTGTISGQESTDSFGECFTTTAPSFGGNSGGPCIDKSGKVIGILVGGISGTESIGYLIPIDRLKVIIDELNNGTILEEPFWGLIFAHTTPTTSQYLGSPADAGAYVSHVEKGSLAEKAGILGGDFVHSINGFELDRFFNATVSWTEYKVSYQDILARIKNGYPAIFEIYRNGKRKTCSVAKTSHSPLKIKHFHIPFDQEPSYDVFGGMVFMELTHNHVEETLKKVRYFCANGYPLPVGILRAILPFSQVCNRHEPRLIITHRFPESEVSKNDIFSIPDYLINTVNGIKVGTIQELQQAIRKGANTGHMVIETEAGSRAVLPLKDILAQEPKLSRKYRYNLSPLVAELAYLK